MHKFHPGHDFLRGRIRDRSGLGGVVAQRPQHGTGSEAREVIDTADALQRRITVAAIGTDVGVGGCRDGGRSRRSGRRFHCDRGEFGAAKLREQQIAKLNLHRAVAAVQLEGEQTGVARNPGLVIIEHGDPRAVQPHFDVRGLGDNSVAVPRGREAKKGFVIVDLTELFRPPPPVGRDRQTRAAGCEHTAAAFLMDVSKAARAEINIGLVAFGAAVGQPLRTKLDAGVGRRRTRQAKLRREFEIGNLTLPVEEFVLRERGARGDFAGDGAVLDVPIGGATRPTSERFPIEDWLRCGRRRERADRASKQG